MCPLLCWVGTSGSCPPTLSFLFCWGTNYFPETIQVDKWARMEEKGRLCVGDRRKVRVQYGDQQGSPSARGTGSDRLPREAKACHGAIYWLLGVEMVSPQEEQSREGSWVEHATSRRSKASLSIRSSQRWDGEVLVQMWRSNKLYQVRLLLGRQVGPLKVFKLQSNVIKTC